MRLVPDTCTASDAPASACSLRRLNAEARLEQRVEPLLAQRHPVRIVIGAYRRRRTHHLLLAWQRIRARQKLRTRVSRVHDRRMTVPMRALYMWVTSRMHSMNFDYKGGEQGCIRDNLGTAACQASLNGIQTVISVMPVIPKSLLAQAPFQRPNLNRDASRHMEKSYRSSLRLARTLR